MALLLEQAPAPSGLRDLSGSALQLARSLPSDVDVIGGRVGGYWFYESLVDRLVVASFWIVVVGYE